MTEQGKILWNQFKVSLIKNINNLNNDERESLNSYSDRKYFFKKLFPKISNDLGLIYENNKEFLRIDYTFFKQDKDWRVPLIFIESENSWDSSYEEAIKLCSLNAPLKILIHYGLTQELKDEIEGNETNWDYIFKDFIKESRLVGLFALMVYSKDQNGKIVFHTMLYGEDGNTLEQDTILIDAVSSSLKP